MYSKILNVDGRQRLVFFARQDIEAGQELTFNYRWVAGVVRGCLVCLCNRGRGIARTLGLGACFADFGRQSRAGSPLVAGLLLPTHLRLLPKLRRFERAEGEERLQCSCGAPNCTGFLN